jgi:hypothetical protein
MRDRLFAGGPPKPLLDDVPNSNLESFTLAAWCVCKLRGFESILSDCNLAAEALLLIFEMCVIKGYEFSESGYATVSILRSGSE